ncbi:cystatin-like protein [Drosophila eugracilis]|uniref:cystatin-like protein n=1 Tax=Drosophila eugracilis TaxID=29029 RepID=UPI001BD9F9AD|nr:cystatin-like protein [Drosophila eugracilis]
MNGITSLCILGLALMSLAAFVSADEAPVVGGVSQLDGESRKEALKLLDDTLAQLATGDGPSYKAINVTSVTTQVVAGTLNTYDLELDNGTEKKKCTVKIWTQPWVKKNGTNIKIKCEGDDGELDRTW